jgi:hypothetical protein
MFPRWPGANVFAEVVGFFAVFFRWPGAIADAPCVVLPVVAARFAVECSMPVVPVAVPDPIVEFVVPLVLWADAAEAAARAKPAATKLMPMRFIVDLLMPGAALRRPCDCRAATVIGL